MTNVLTMKSIKRALQTKKEHLEAIYHLTREQDALICELDVVGLMDNLNDRQRHIEAVEKLEGELPDRRSLLMNHDCAKLAVEINDVVASIQKLDAHNQQKARDCLVFLKRQAKKVSEGRRAGTGYEGGPAVMGATYFDSHQ